MLFPTNQRRIGLNILSLSVEDIDSFINWLEILETNKECFLKVQTHLWFAFYFFAVLETFYFFQTITICKREGFMSLNFPPFVKEINSDHWDQTDILLFLTLNPHFHWKVLYRSSASSLGII